MSKLYSNGIIYPKYRNMAAMCTMYEYLASGRCSELTGPNGAYNLYEMEIRQNIIIVSLVVIVNDLEKIKENQYQLYQQLKQTNDLIYGVGQEMRSIYNTTKSIERTVNSIQENSYVSAECAKITAQNSEALKYISLVNAAK